MGVLITIDSSRYLRIVEYRMRRTARQITAILCEAAVRVANIQSEVSECLHHVEIAASYQSYLSQDKKLRTARVVSLAEYREVQWGLESFGDALNKIVS